MRIALSTSVIQRGQSGVGQYVLALVRALLPAAARHEFTLYVLEEDLPLFGFAAGRMRLEVVAERHRPPVRNILWHQTELPRLLRRSGTDLLHVPSYRRMLWPRPCALVATIHDLAPFHLAGKYDRARMFYGRVIGAAARPPAGRDHRGQPVDGPGSRLLFRDPRGSDHGRAQRGGPRALPAGSPGRRPRGRLPACGRRRPVLPLCGPAGAPGQKSPAPDRRLRPLQGRQPVGLAAGPGGQRLARRGDDPRPDSRVAVRPRHLRAGLRARPPTFRTGTARPMPSSFRLCTRASGCRPSRPWPAAVPSSPRPVGRSETRSAMPPAGWIRRMSPRCRPSSRGSRPMRAGAPNCARPASPGPANSTGKPAPRPRSGSTRGPPRAGASPAPSRCPGHPPPGGPAAHETAHRQAFRRGLRQRMRPAPGPARMARRSGTIRAGPRRRPPPAEADADPPRGGPCRGRRPDRASPAQRRTRYPGAGRRHREGIRGGARGSSARSHPVGLPPADFRRAQGAGNRQAGRPGCPSSSSPASWARRSRSKR